MVVIVGPPRQGAVSAARANLATESGLVTRHRSEHLVMVGCDRVSPGRSYMVCAGMRRADPDPVGRAPSGRLEPTSVPQFTREWPSNGRGCRPPGLPTASTGKATWGGGPARTEAQR